MGILIENAICNFPFKKTINYVISINCDMFDNCKINVKRIFVLIIFLLIGHMIVYLYKCEFDYVISLTQSQFAKCMNI